MISPKVALLFGAGAGISVAMIELATGVGLTGQPLLDGLLGGTGITLIAVGMYKAKFDRLIKDVEGKADRTVSDQRFDRIEASLDRIENHLLNRHP